MPAGIARGSSAAGLLGLAILLAAAGCEDVRHDFLPLARGSVWTYRVVSEGRELGRESVRVLEELKPRGDDTAERFRVEEPAAVAVWTKDRRTVLRVTAGTVTTVLQHPPFVGFGWTDRGPGGALVYCKVVAREYVRTPAGWFFDCVVVRRDAQDRSSVVTQWFAPDVGLVKWTVERPERPEVSWELEEYRAGSPSGSEEN